MIPEVARRLSRRGVVAVAAVSVVAGCSGGGGTGSGGSPRPELAPGAAETARAARDSAALLARYDAVAAAHPSLAARLAPLRAEVARHVQAFGGRPEPTTAPATPTATATATTPATPAQALAALATAERTLADRRAATLLTVPGDLARLLASVAAAGAGHVVLLSAGAKNV